MLCASLIFSNLIGGVAASSDNQSIDVKAEMPKIQASMESGGSLDTTRHVTFSCTEIEPDCKVFVTTDGSQPDPKPENTNKEPSNKKESATPKTGDDNSAILWMLLLLVVAQGIVWGKKKFYR